jgi:hypothetical protein
MGLEQSFLNKICGSWLGALEIVYLWKFAKDVDDDCLQSSDLRLMLQGDGD